MENSSVEASWLTFRVAGLILAVPALSTDGVIMPPPSARRHGIPGNTGSLFHHSDKTYRLTDLRKRLGDTAPAPDGGRLILWHYRDRYFALQVDEVLGLVRQTRAVPLPADLPRTLFTGAFRHGEKLALCTEPARLDNLRDAGPVRRYMAPPDDAPEPGPDPEPKTGSRRASPPPAKPAVPEETRQPASRPATAPAPRPRPAPRGLDRRPSAVDRPTPAAPEQPKATAATPKTKPRPAGTEPVRQSSEAASPLRDVMRPPASSESEPPRSIETQDPTQTPPPEPPESRFAAVLVGAAVALIAGAGALLWQLGNGKPGPFGSEQSSPPAPAEVIAEQRGPSPAEYRPRPEPTPAPVTAPVNSPSPQSRGTPSPPVKTEQTPQAAGKTRFEVMRRNDGLDLVVENASPTPGAQALLDRAEAAPPADAPASGQPVSAVPVPAAKNRAETPAEAPAPRERIVVHTVVRGDTLWDIATRYVNDPWRYRELAARSGMNDPDLIYPGDKVRIIFRDAPDGP